MTRFLPLLLALPITLASAQGGHERRYELRPDPNWPLSIDLGSGEYQIVASASDSIAVVYQEATDKQQKIQVQIGSGHGQNYLKIDGPRTNFRAIIEIPRKTDLKVRMLAGDLHVGAVEGNKDIEVRKGTLELNAIRPEDYSKTDFSVRVGDVNAPIFKATKGAMWRSVRTSGPGKYRLHAFVGIGDLTLHADDI